MSDGYDGDYSDGLLRMAASFPMSLLFNNVSDLRLNPFFRVTVEPLKEKETKKKSISNSSPG